MQSNPPLRDDLPLYRISVPTPFPVGPVNLYLIREPEPVLVDTGPAIDGAMDRLTKGLEACGVPIAQLSKIIITHFHIDHVGLAGEVAERSGAPIYANPIETGQLTGDPRMGAFFLRMMQEGGLAMDLIERQREQFEAIRAAGEPLAHFRSVDDLGEVRCGPAAFRVLPTPGHTPGSISLWEPMRRILLAADTVIKHITPNPFLAPDPRGLHGRFPSLSAYLRTLERIRALDPAVIYGGHGEPVEDFARHHDGLLKFHKQRLKAVRSCLRRKPHTAAEVSRCLFPEAHRYGSFLALSEIFAHLDLLEERGEIRREMRGPVAIYSILANRGAGRT